MRPSHHYIYGIYGVPSITSRQHLYADRVVLNKSKDSQWVHLLAEFLNMLLCKVQKEVFAPSLCWAKAVIQMQIRGYFERKGVLLLVTRWKEERDKDNLYWLQSLFSSFTSTAEEHNLVLAWHSWTYFLLGNTPATLALAINGSHWICWVYVCMLIYTCAHVAIYTIAALMEEFLEVFHVVQPTPGINCSYILDNLLRLITF